MRNLKFMAILGVLLITPFILSGCTVGTAKKTSLPDGGLWKSSDNGKTWSQSVSMPTISGKPIRLDKAEISRIVFDSQDPAAVYLSTNNYGIIYSYDSGKTWNQFKQLNSGTVKSIAVDPKNKCLIYALNKNVIYKTVDCGREWKNIYYHQNQEVVLNDIAIDPNNSSIIFVVNSSGEILKSLNAGASWDASYRLKDNILDLLIDPRDSRLVYAATAKSGIFKTVDGGVIWASLGEGLKSYSGSQGYVKMIFDSAVKDSLIFISKYGMLKTGNGGVSWSIIDLLPAPKSTAIYSLAINPKNSNEIYYTTATTLVSSADGGKTWTSSKLPFTKLPSALAVDPANGSNLFLGTVNPAK